MDMTAEEFRQAPDNILKYGRIDEMMEAFASLKTKELKKQLQKEAMKQLSLLDKIKELEDGIEILKELCQLKQYKDEVGKDSFYQKRQPELWKLANEFLNQH